MHLIVLLLFIIGCSCDIKVSVDQKGAYNISINNNVWLRSAQTALYVDNKWHSSDDNSLRLMNITTGQGTDPNLGNWNETQLNYDLVRSGIHTTVVASIRQWYDVSAITFHLNTGNQVLINTKTLDADAVRTVFPSFHIEKLNGKEDEQAYFTFAGMMTGDTDKHAGKWGSLGTVIKSGLESGPLVLFNTTQRGESDILILSPFSQFMATSLAEKDHVLEYGVIGSIVSIPNNYNHSLILFYSSKGINEGIREWGQTMQKAYNRTNEYRLNDLTINNLGYYTDNGAYYYYHTVDKENYEQTMLDTIHQIHLPFHYLQLDSWWYYQGIKDGVTNWTARPDVFPNGLEGLDHELFGLPLVAHNRYWAYDNVYKQNYSFILDEKNGKALPVGNDSFWIDLFTEARRWNLTVYEQDWLITQTKEFSPILADIDLGHHWLRSMGEAANQLNINLQYCMGLSRHILTALEIPRVTHTRVSEDYAIHIAGLEQQWTIGISSMLADAIGLAPFKDVFWSTSLQPGSHSYGPKTEEVLPEREILIATLSTGPVAPGDGIQYTNIERIMKCCRSDGLILKPDRPLTAINALISDWALHDSISQGELYSTRTTINNQTFHIVFASDMKQDYLINPAMIGAQPGIIWSYNDVNDAKPFNDAVPLEVSAKQCHHLSFCLWYISPLQSFNDSTSAIHYAFLGALNKWTAVSQQRFSSIVSNTTNNEVMITVEGISGEIVPIVVSHSVLSVVTVNCSISAITGQAHVIITTTNVTCSS